ncbi:MAG TPA: hypothetical protein VNH11_32420 [Pirellulales bacterium]|nr:hypothetical protein [Pirellulales bacterium]
MGNFYVNHTLRGPSQQAVGEALLGRSAVVTPMRDGCVVVFDEQSDDQDPDAISRLGERLSRQFDCPVLAVLNHDDDILWYQLYVGGELIDEYNSCPDYFEADESFDGDEPGGPSGGDAEKLCRAFGAGNVAAVEKVLRSSGDDSYVFAVERHQDLVQALGIPSFGVGAGYRNIMNGESPDGLAAKDLLKVT